MANWSSISRTGSQSWKFVPSGTSPYTIILDGRVLEEEFEKSAYYYEGEDYDNEPPPLELLDDNDTSAADSQDYPPFLVLQWRGISEASYYLVQEYVASVWTTQYRVKELGQGYYSQATTRIDDGDADQWRVVAVDKAGTSGEAMVATGSTMVCHPQPPDITLSYSSGTGDVTVAAAT